ncbi:class I SAM-dependent methyltransferase [Rickettsia helvetica]|uniref:Class I SAM-dependent methyltransferase n=1 Tax=Rickettsia helvetica TaxID=35789 RepID=A0ABM9NB26_RICHE|nr:class I SAM-dependent methyltransferase [Rickettsia helvetica]MCZ6884568.1 class I SAM-dependent methyltransferase [Rickettsia endosymbiont of Ixodes ricinus]MCZ6896364.1 class I SAM-dependent methyltransferase [Rickettsia endosymbiont of Ixodes ricinus]
MKNIQYNNNNAQEFYNRIINADLSDNYKAFTSYLPEKAHILDAGCGVGRNTKYFLSQGYQVTAFDGSTEMVKLASKETGTNVRQLTFQDIDFDELCDGVWTQATLLHVPYNETTNVYKKIHAALKPEGIFYASYGYGSDIIQSDDRDFYNMNEDTIKPYFNGLLEIVKIWTEKSKRFSPSKEALWLNFIVKKSKTI